MCLCGCDDVVCGRELWEWYLCLLEGIFDTFEGGLYCLLKSSKDSMALVVESWIYTIVMMPCIHNLLRSF